MISSITTSLNVSLSVNQNIVISTSSVYFSLEKLSIDSLNNRTNDHIRLPTFTNFSTSIVLLRVDIYTFFFFKTKTLFQFSIVND